MTTDKDQAVAWIPADVSWGMCRYCWRQTLRDDRCTRFPELRDYCGEHAPKKACGRRWKSIERWVQTNEKQTVRRSAWGRVYDLLAPINPEVWDIDSWRAGRRGYGQAVRSGGLQPKAAELATLELGWRTRKIWRIPGDQSPHAILVAFAHALDEIEREYTAAMGAKRGKQPAEGRRSRGRPSKRDTADLSALRARWNSGVPLADLAVEHGVDPSTMSRWLSDYRES